MGNSVYSSLNDRKNKLVACISEYSIKKNHKRGKLYYYKLFCTELISQASAICSCVPFQPPPPVHKKYFI